jgi:2-keto-4-pentenoate hydratase/2-oxohepta-3-ene-1,7-dioic acid hydratase in catechol pathway
MDKFICVGKNYLDHAKELGDAIPEMPVLFLKPPSTAVTVKEWGQTLEVALPRDRGSVHYECEIIVQIDADRKIKAVTLGLDMTLREMQGQLKKQGHPWELSKVFKNSAIVGPWIPFTEFSHYLNEEFSFHLNGEIKQKAFGTQMRLSPKECIAYAAQYFPLCQGDLFFTGTPAGVGPVQPGQTAELRWGTQRFYRVLFTDSI